MNGWSPDDFGPDASAEALAYLDSRLTLHKHPPRYGKSFFDRVQEWQLANGYKGTALGQAADGYVGPTQLHQLKADPVIMVPSRISRQGWKLTPPSGIEVLQPAFETFEQKPWFWEDADGTQVFRAPTNGGGTTPNTIYLRSETREMEDDGRTKAAWSSEEPHIFKGRLAFTALPHVKEHAVGFQIHDLRDDVMMGRLEGPRLFIESPYFEDLVLEPNYKLGTFFDIEIYPSLSGIQVVYNRGAKVVTLEDVVGEDWYYKYGCYCQAKAGQEYKGQIVPKDSYAETRFRAAAVTRG